MSKRIEISALEPKAYEPMLGLEGYLAETDLEPKLRELIKLKASIINKCAFCIQMHTAQALELGEDQQRLFALAAWQESPLFTERERAVLALTEAVTRIGAAGLPDTIYNAALAELGEQQLAQCLMQVVTINAWNRIALSTRMVHPA